MPSSFDELNCSLLPTALNAYIFLSTIVTNHNSGTGRSGVWTIQGIIVSAQGQPAYSSSRLLCGCWIFFLLLFFLFCCLFHPHEHKISVCSLRACCVLLFFILSFSDFYLLGLNHLVVSLSISSLLETGEPPCTKTGFPLVLSFPRQSSLSGLCLAPLLFWFCILQVLLCQN